MDISIAPVTVDNQQEEKIGKESSKGGWKSAIFIIFVEIAERFAYYGVAGNLIMYLTAVLGQTVAKAAKNVNIWTGVSAIFPLLGGFLADSYLGRFKTIVISSVTFLMVGLNLNTIFMSLNFYGHHLSATLFSAISSYLFSQGLILLILSVTSIIPLGHRETIFFIALYVLAVGEGGHKPCVQTFAAHQFDEDMPEEKKAKSSFFNWWYLGIVFGSTSAVLVVIYVQDNIGWAVGFAIPTAAVAVALALFLIGSWTYRRESPVGSPFTAVAQVFVAAARKRRVSEKEVCWDDGISEGVARSLARTSQFRILDKAMFVDSLDASSGTRNPWRLCSVNQVEEVKLLLRLVPIWFSCMIFAIMIAQTSTFFTKQGSTMVRSLGPHFNIPPASLHAFTGFTILIIVPIYDRIIVPIARNITGHPSGLTMLRRLGIGIFFSILLMVVAALVETQRVKIARENGLIDSPRMTVPMSVWWLLPQYIINGLTDVFTIIGMQELFYDQVPEKMRSMGAALYISTIGAGSLMSSVVISIVQGVSSRFGNEWLGDNLNRANLDNFYWVLAGLSTLNMTFYLWVAKGFVYKKVEWDASFEGKE